MADSSVRSRILVVDDAPAVREALRWVIEDTPDLEIVGETGRGLEVESRVTNLQPDLVVLDVHLPDLSGYAVARALKAMTRPPVIVFLSVDSDEDAKRRGLEVGDVFVTKSQGWDGLLTNIRTALSSRRTGKIPTG